MPPSLKQIWGHNLLSPSALPLTSKARQNLVQTKVQFIFASEGEKGQHNKWKRLCSLSYLTEQKKTTKDTSLTWLNLTENRRNQVINLRLHPPIKTALMQNAELTPKTTWATAHEDAFVGSRIKPGRKGGAPVRCQYNQLRQMFRHLHNSRAPKSV